MQISMSEISKVRNYDVMDCIICNSFAKAEFIISNENSTSMDDEEDVSLDDMRKYECSGGKCDEEYKYANSQNSEINSSLHKEELKSFVKLQRGLQFYENMLEDLSNSFKQSLKVFQTSVCLSAFCMYVCISVCLPSRLSVYLYVCLAACV